MHILALVRNYIPAYKQVLDGRWDIVEIAANAHDLEGKTVELVREYVPGLRHLILTYCIITIFGSVLLKNLYLVYGILL